MLGSIALGAPPSAAAQDALPEAPPSPPPGRYTLGPFYLTPYFRLGTLGVDSNVFYTATDRRADFAASGGPGLLTILPLGGKVRAVLDGSLNYIFFLRTESQRKLAGSARAAVEWRGNRLEGHVQEAFSRSFERSSLEVDSRLLQDQWTTSGELYVRTPARLGVRPRVELRRYDLPPGQEFLGTDVAVTLTRRESIFSTDLDYTLTPKTSILIGADVQLDRFPLDPTRDADSNRLYAGLELRSETRLSGRAVAGPRFFRPQDPRRGGDRTVPYVFVDLAYQIAPRTRALASYQRDIGYSAFTGPAAATLTQKSLAARIEKGLWGRLELYLWGRLIGFRNDGPVRIEEEGKASLVRRDDHAREAGLDLGYRFGSRLRVGLAASYTSRSSTIADLGVHGLLVGGTVSYDPNKR